MMIRFKKKALWMVQMSNIKFIIVSVESPMTPQVVCQPREVHSLHAYNSIDRAHHGWPWCACGSSQGASDLKLAKPRDTDIGL